MPRTPPPLAQDFVPFATAALDFHLALNLPVGPLAAPRPELDSLHAHLVSLHALLDAHACRTGRLAPAESNHLAAARLRIWQAADRLHAAYHAAPRGPQERGTDLPEGPPALTICRRHQRATRLARRHTTPTDIARP
ncbi:DUF6238 family protein [Streptomyces sp. HPF1205]|uniref:DUF6238 family protein n=1 Tax=Streptomyces sp. HPF1205 TaxID=2873262 RepID=UPI001CED23A6|nr:DUF6238 family protein [Streptomyces sp. HPF1205]